PKPPFVGRLAGGATGPMVNWKSIKAVRMISGSPSLRHFGTTNFGDARQTAPQNNLTRLFQLFQPSSQTRLEATYDSNRAACPTIDVVADGAGAMAVIMAGQQSL